VDRKLGRRTDSRAHCHAGPALAHDERVVWLGTEFEELLYERAPFAQAGGQLLFHLVL
jgi:hypothetical protein